MKNSASCERPCTARARLVSSLVFLGPQREQVELAFFVLNNLMYEEGITRDFCYVVFYNILFCWYWARKVN